jgi:glycosyltransferase involved in cell wall biosynthesis
MGLMKASDIFVMPSRYEGISIAMIEAMACGLPIVTSNAPGLRTYIKQGQNGLLFPVEDHKALAKCILKLAEDRNMRAKLSLGARESFDSEFDMRRNIKYLDIFFRQYTAEN